MKQMVSLLSSGLAQVLIIDSLDARVVVRLAQGLGIVHVIEDFRAEGADINCVTDVTGLARLSAAVDAATGAGHDLDELIIVHLAVANLLHDLAGI